MMYPVEVLINRSSGKSYRGQKGEVYFLASKVPHAIRNIGDTPCQYFAFQWGNGK